jgi:hypothetical protein
VGRIAMLCVGVALLYLYLSAGIHMLSTWRQARSDSSTVAAMEHEHVLLKRQHEVLGGRGTMEEEARRLGMMKRGEQSYVVTGLPDN